MVRRSSHSFGGMIMNRTYPVQSSRNGWHHNHWKWFYPLNYKLGAQTQLAVTEQISMLWGTAIWLLKNVFNRNCCLLSYNIGLEQQRQLIMGILKLHYTAPEHHKSKTLFKSFLLFKTNSPIHPRLPCFFVSIGRCHNYRFHWVKEYSPLISLPILLR